MLTLEEEKKKKKDWLLYGKVTWCAHMILLSMHVEMYNPEEKKNSTSHDGRVLMAVLRSSAVSSSIEAQFLHFYVFHFGRVKKSFILFFLNLDSNTI